MQTKQQKASSFGRKEQKQNKQKWKMKKWKNEKMKKKEKQANEEEMIILLWMCSLSIAFLGIDDI